MKKLFKQDKKKQINKKKLKKRKKQAKILAKRSSFNPTEKNQTENKKIQHYKDRLQSSQFRILNEHLYTKDSKSVEKYFSSNPDEFEMVK
jgi:hypothetical protein